MRKLTETNRSLERSRPWGAERQLPLYVVFCLPGFRFEESKKLFFPLEILSISSTDHAWSLDIVTAAWHGQRSHYLTWAFYVEVESVCRFTDFNDRNDLQTIAPGSGIFSS